MTLLAAATVGDDIVHTPLLGQILKVATTIGAGLLTGMAIGVAAAFIVGTGGLGAVVLGAVVGAIIGVAADAGARALGANSLDDLITKPIHSAIDKVCPGEVEGKILSGSSNVFINGLPAARAAGRPDPGFAARQTAREAAPPPSLLESVAKTFLNMLSPPEPDFGFIATEEDKVLCKKHPPNPEQYMAEGSATVFINGQPAVRITDKSTCEGKVSLNPAHAAKRNVSIGGGTVQVRAISTEMPPWLDKVSRYAGMAIGLCQAIRGKGPLLGKVLCFGKNMVLGMAADMAVRSTETYLSGQIGHPVHVPTGAKILNGEHDQDFVLQALLPVDWTRFYNSSNTRAGLFGRGWMVLHDLELQLNQPDPEAPGSQHAFIDLQGRRLPLPVLAAGEKFHADQEGLTFAHTEGGHFMVQFSDGQVIDFGHVADPDAPALRAPQVIEDRNGNAHHLRYDPQGRLHQIASSCGQLLTLEHDAQHPRRIGAIHRRIGTEQRLLVRYGYDSDGRLTQVRNSADDVLRAFTYDSSHRMGMQRLPHGLEVRYEWQEFKSPGDTHSRVVGYSTSTGEQVRIQYTLRPDGSGTAQSMDPMHRSHLWAWDSLKRITHYQNPVDGQFTLTWDEHKRQLLSATNPEGGVSRFAYDARGRLRQETDPLGHTHSTRWHDEFDEPVEQTAPDGAKWTWEYDAVGNLVHETAPGDLEQHWTHNDQGQVVAHVDARGGIGQYAYSPQGRLLQSTDCSQRSTRYAHDALGQLVSETDAAGHVTSYRYDAHGRLQAATLPDGMEQSWQWRADGRPQAQTVAGASTRYEWNEDGSLASITDPLNRTTRWVHDPAGRPTQLIDGQGAVTSFEHDAADRQTAQTGIDGLRTEYEFNACGRPIAVTQAAGTPHAIRLEFKRDALGRLVSKTTPETTTHYRYDAAGRVTHVMRHIRGGSPEDKPRRVDEIDFEYDKRGRLIRETSTIERLWEQRLGAGGKWTLLPEPHCRTIRHEHDALGFTTRTVLPGEQTLDYLCYGSGHLHQINLNGQLISDIERDELHREVSRTQGRLRSEFKLDPVGRVLTKLASVQNLPGMPLFAQPNRAASAAPSWQDLGQRQTGRIVAKGYAYAADGNLQKRIDAEIGERHFAHDAAGQVLRSQLAPAAHWSRLQRDELDETFAWDKAANAVPCDRSTAPGLTLHAGRVENNRVMLWQDIRYQYDAHGRMVSKQAGKRSHMRLAWNCEHQLIASTTERAGLSTQRCQYHYDALGRRIAKSDGFATTWFTWDGLRMVQEERGGRCVTTVYEDAQSYVPLARAEHGAEGHDNTPLSGEVRAVQC